MEPYKAQPNRKIFNFLKVEFVEDLREFQCDRCENKLFEHYIANCGHKFCHNCKRLVGDGSGRWKCPQCREYIKTVDKEDVEFEERFFNQEVYCSNKNYGCDFKDKLTNILSHIQECDKTKEDVLPVLLKPPPQIENIWEEIIKLNRKIEEHKNGGDDNARVEEENLELKRDLEDLKASHDLIKESFDDLKAEVETHKKNQDKINDRTKHKLENIENDIGIQKTVINLQANNNNAQIQNLDEFKKVQNTEIHHLKSNIEELETKIKDETDQTKLQMIETKDQFEKLQNEQQTDTANFSQQLDEQIRSTKELMHEIEITQRKFDEAKKELDWKIDDCKQTATSVKLKLNKVENIVSFLEFQKEENNPEDTVENNSLLLETVDVVHTWKIENFERELEENFDYCTCEVFPLPAYDCSARATLELKNEIISISLCLLNGKEAGHPIDLKIIPYVTFSLKDRNNYENVLKSITHLHNSKLRFGTSFYSVELGHKTTITDDPRFVNEDSLTIEIAIEPPSVARLIKSYNGSLMGKISDYFCKKERAVKGLVEREPSPYFYTDRPGYRVQVMMYLNGCLDYKGKGISAVIYFLTGEFDEKISDSCFDHKTTFLIYNPKNLNKTLIKSVTNGIDGLKWYSIDVATHREIEDGGYVENDTLIYKVIIEPAQE